jgi:hypothetical protein
MRVPVAVAVLIALALPAASNAGEPPPKRDCGAIKAVGDRMHVRTFTRPFVKCAAARKLMRRTFTSITSDGAVHRLGGWKCAWPTDEMGGISAECARGKRVVMAWNGVYGE